MVLRHGKVHGVEEGTNITVVLLLLLPSSLGGRAPESAAVIQQ